MILFRNVSLSRGTSTTRFGVSPFIRRRVTIFTGRETKTHILPTKINETKSQRSALLTIFFSFRIKEPFNNNNHHHHHNNLRSHFGSSNHFGSETLLQQLRLRRVRVCCRSSPRNCILRRICQCMCFQPVRRSRVDQANTGDGYVGPAGKQGKNKADITWMTSSTSLSPSALPVPVP